MATIQRFRHGKNYTNKVLATGPLGTGASSTDNSPIWETINIRLGGPESYMLTFDRDEAAYIIESLTSYLKRDTRVINGKVHNA